MEKIVLTNPEEFDVESAVIYYDFEVSEYVMDVYSKAGHKDFTAKTTAALKAKFTREYVGGPSVKANWKSMEYSGEESTDPDESEVDAGDDTDRFIGEEKKSENYDPMAVIRGRLIDWVSSVEDQEKFIDLGGTRFTLKQILIELKNNTSIGNLMTDVVFGMFLGYIKGEFNAQTLVPKEVVENSVSKTDTSQRLFYGAISEMSYLPDGTVIFKIATQPQYMLPPYFSEGVLQTHLENIIPVSVSIYPELGVDDGN